MRGRRGAPAVLLPLNPAAAHPVAVTVAGWTGPTVREPVVLSLRTPGARGAFACELRTPTRRVLLCWLDDEALALLLDHTAISSGTHSRRPSQPGDESTELDYVPTADPNDVSGRYRFRVRPCLLPELTVEIRIFDLHQARRRRGFERVQVYTFYLRASDAEAFVVEMQARL